MSLTLHTPFTFAWVGARTREVTFTNVRCSGCVWRADGTRTREAYLKVMFVAFWIWHTSLRFVCITTFIKPTLTHILNKQTNQKYSTALIRYFKNVCHAISLHLAITIITNNWFFIFFVILYEYLTNLPWWNVCLMQNYP